MADAHKLSEHVIDMARRFEDVVDAAEGKGNRGSSGIGTKWLLLPAAGAGLYALMTSNSVGRHAKGVLDQAKSRAAELPDDLMNRVRQTSQTQGSRSNGATPAKQPAPRTTRHGRRARRASRPLPVDPLASRRSAGLPGRPGLGLAGRSARPSAKSVRRRGLM